METPINTAELVEETGGNPQNLRQERRVPANATARIVLADMTGVQKCQILDISKGGAKLDVGDWTDAPKDFYLLVRVGGSDERLLRWCERRWVVGTTMGVRFRDAPVGPKDLLSILPPNRDKLPSN